MLGFNVDVYTIFVRQTLKIWINNLICPITDEVDLALVMRGVT